MPATELGPGIAGLRSVRGSCRSLLCRGESRDIAGRPTPGPVIAPRLAVFTGGPLGVAVLAHVSRQLFIWVPSVPIRPARPKAASCSSRKFRRQPSHPGSLRPLRWRRLYRVAPALVRSTRIKNFEMWGGYTGRTNRQRAQYVANPDWVRCFKDTQAAIVRNSRRMGRRHHRFCLGGTIASSRLKPSWFVRLHLYYGGPIAPPPPPQNPTRSPKVPVQMHFGEKYGSIR